ncbi:hypothetical protein BSLG_000207 [Batrachochytrium salamandrivorans]|nr:hypothetical protein BASA60_004986 [Batrachochytrium salamandrivorans]KAJ1344684.1 hypothetical protein BSLG_000207 [Batrachochytrium salamandrivorans]
MDSLVASYDSCSETDGEKSPTRKTASIVNSNATITMTPTTTVEPVVKRTKIDLAPDVLTQDLSTFAYIPSVTTKEIAFNVPYQDLSRPLQGPANPFVAAKAMANRNTMTGFVEDHNMSEHSFNELHRTFVNFGYTKDPDAQCDGQYVGDKKRMNAKQGALVSEIKPSSSTVTKKRKPKGDPSDIDGYAGPWAGYEGEQMDVPDRTAEQDSWAPTDDPEAHERARAAALAAKAGSERTIFHGKSEKDYLGRTYMHVPHDTGVDLHSEPGSQECFLPKRLIHTWTGHTKGVNAIRFLPETAHLLLSAGMDSKVMLWDVYNDRQCLRTYAGHHKGVRDISFSNDGRRFLSASYDKYLKLWDTETGACISRFTTKRVPYCVKFNPDPAKQDIFLTGCQDKKIYQFDIRTGEIVQEYDQHLGAVNTITFVDDNRRFVTTSDDKTLRAWEVDIPVVIKYVAEPDMHSMPAVTLSHNKKWLACQSLDNQIIIYSARDRFRINRKKVFKGHLVAGYACQPNFSPDTRYILSGDSEGKIWFWDWKTCKMVKKIKAHDGVVMGCEWHPHETSKVATCSWDGTIKFWD